MKRRYFFGFLCLFLSAFFAWLALSPSEPAPEASRVPISDLQRVSAEELASTTGVSIKYFAQFEKVSAEQYRFLIRASNQVNGTPSRIAGFDTRIIGLATTVGGISYDLCSGTIGLCPIPGYSSTSDTLVDVNTKGRMIFSAVDKDLTGTATGGTPIDTQWVSLGTFFFTQPPTVDFNPHILPNSCVAYIDSTDNFKEKCVILQAESSATPTPVPATPSATLVPTGGSPAVTPTTPPLDYTPDPNEPTSTRGPSLPPPSTPKPGTPTRTPTLTRTPTPTLSLTPTQTPTKTQTPTPTPSYTPTPSKIPTGAPTATPTLRPGPYCDSTCGVCGWRDVSRVCRPTGPMTDGQSCCYKTCVQNACTTVSGYGVDACTTAASCLVTPTSAVTSTSAPLAMASPVTSPIPTPTPSTLNLQPSTISTPTPVTHLPQTGDTHWTIWLLIPAAILILGIVM